MSVVIPTISPSSLDFGDTYSIMSTAYSTTTGSVTFEVLTFLRIFYTSLVYKGPAGSVILPL